MADCGQVRSVYRSRECQMKATRPLGVSAACLHVLSHVGGQAWWDCRVAWECWGTRYCFTLDPFQWTVQIPVSFQLYDLFFWQLNYSGTLFRINNRTSRFHDREPTAPESSTIKPFGTYGVLRSVWAWSLYEATGIWILEGQIPAFFQSQF
jgi:hypothetical protein